MRRLRVKRVIKLPSNGWISRNSQRSVNVSPTSRQRLANVSPTSSQRLLNVFSVDRVLRTLGIGTFLIRNWIGFASEDERTEDRLRSDFRVLDSSRSPLERLRVKRVTKLPPNGRILRNSQRIVSVFSTSCLWTGLVAVWRAKKEFTHF